MNQAFFMQGGIDGSCKTYKNFSSLNSHVYRHHRHKVCKETLNVIDTCTENNGENEGTKRAICNTSGPQRSNSPVVDDSLTDFEVSELLGDAEDEQKRICALFS